MLNKFLKNYNNNRKTIWIIIAFVTFFIILLHAINGKMQADINKRQEEQLKAYYQSLNTTENVIRPNDSIVTNDISGDNITINSSSEDVIKFFIKLCNDKNIKEAYNMISEDCKKVLFPTISDFENNYYNKIFNKKRMAKIENSMYGKEIYKVTYIENLLISGGKKSEKEIQDYIYAINENNKMKVSLNKFLYTREINQEKEQDNIFFKIIKMAVYADYEQYQIQIINNSSNSIYIIPESENVYLLDKNEVKYKSNIDELQTGSTLLKPNKLTDFEIKFNKNYKLNGTSKIIIFDKIITNYEEYKEGTKEEIIENIYINI